MESATHTPDFFATARFKHPWRSHQARVLKTLDEHLQDDHLHVVAPPGSGKTVLGLEVVRRLGRPALVLVPTITIREQWLRRLRMDFFDAEDAPGEVSTDLLAPAMLTVSTYQALHSLFKPDDGRSLLAALRGASVATLAVDEAHHLRSEWWRCLHKVKNGLPGVKTVALTGTPPYDAPQIEWNRYATFCGEVDEEIGVPELVLDGHLCPHQDLIYLCLPEEQALEQLRTFRVRVEGFFRDLAIDTELARILASVPQVVAPKENLDGILKHSEFWLGVAVFLNGLMWEAAAGLLKAMGLRRVNLPAFDLAWASVLMDGLLFGGMGNGPALGGKSEQLRQRLRGIGALERRRVILDHDPYSRRLLRSGPGMLRSISDIAELESRQQQHRLRLVILTDHVREKAFPSVQDPDKPVAKLGVVPIFETLRRLRLPDVRLCILTGSVVVVPADCTRALRDGVAARGIPGSRLRRRALWHAPDYVRIELSESDRKKGVELVTEIFREGLVNTIVGTASLLGEGWDAPSVNTLVLASTVATYVTSNQMRGRAIRTARHDPFKVANIWHLACVEPDQGDQLWRGLARGLDRPCAGSDLAGVARRFRAFVGVSLSRTVIESGIERLGLTQCRLTAPQVSEWNTRMARHAGRREQLQASWREALGPPNPGIRRLVRELEVDNRRFLPRFLARQQGDATAGLWRGPFKWWAQRRARSRFKGIAMAVAEALGELGIIGAEHSDAPPVAITNAKWFQASLPAASHLGQTRFVEAMAEVFEATHSPRYLLRKGRRYYAVPDLCGENKKRAMVFMAAWRKWVGRAELIFTQRTEGKLHLLKAREQALAEYFDYRVDTRARWVDVAAGG